MTIDKGCFNNGEERKGNTCGPHGFLSVLRSTRFSLIMANWGTMLVFFASLYPTATRFTFIEALKKYGLCLLFHLNSPFPPTVTDCSGITLTLQFSVLRETEFAFIQFSLIQEMAEGVLFDIAKEIIGKAGDLALKEVALIWGVKDEINKLKETVSKISAVILDAEAKQHGSEVIKEWLKRLKDAMCDADDLLDEISTEALRREVMTGDKKAKEVRIFFSKYNQLAYGVRMGHKVKEMRERLVAIDAEPADRQFHLDERREEIQVRNVSRRQTHSLVSAEDVIGREEDKKVIIGSLLDPNVKENVSVLAIVGIGGLGKTTVAQLVFNDEKVKNHFELKLWVCVSENFDVKIIVQKILECLKNEKPKDLEKNMLVNNLQKEINGKRYMLVLDDVWNEDREKWSELKQIIMGGAQGSRILVTTRSVKVAKISRPSQPHVLQGLEEQLAWSLFKKMAFEEGEEPKEASFVNIGKDILKICVGVPLAIRTIGGLLYFKKSEREWLSFKDNGIQILSISK
uniref:Disease resistance protein RGA3 n=1 Tax=Quercus lobata TaxID=97700 RepID=A0A7N2LAJ5_QUELO